jgi:endoglucanase
VKSRSVLRNPHCLILLLIHASAPPAQIDRGFVHANGSVLVDDQGKLLYLKGINFGNWFEPEGYLFYFDYRTVPQPLREIENLTKVLRGRKR